MTVRTLVTSLVVIGLLGCVSSAFAVTSPLVFEKDYVLEETEWSYSFVFDQFDPSFGSLYKIEVAVQAQTLGDAGWENKSTKRGATVIVNFDSTVSADAPLWATVSTTMGDAPPPYSLTTWDGTTDYAGTSGGQRHYDSGIVGPTVQAIATGDLGWATISAAYTGLGTISMPVYTTSNAWLNVVGGSVQSDFVQKSSANVKVKYYFEPVPEPGSVATCLMGLGGMALYAIRRRK